MNQRIKELMLEAGYAAPEIAGRAQKLAELIISECLALCDNVEADAEMPGLSDGALVCATEIKEHFGVK